MNSLISNPINTPLPFSVSYGIINIQHSVYKDLPDLISLLTKDNLDQRRLVAVSSEHYPSMGEKWIKEAWDKVLNKFQTHHLGNGEVLKQLSKQAKGILSFKPIPAKGTHIKDPFNMRPVEVVSIHALAREQIKKARETETNNGNITSNGSGASTYCIPLILKADTGSSLEAIISEIKKLATDRVCAKIIFSGIGTIGESDVRQASGKEKAVIVGFSVKVDSPAKHLAERDEIVIKTFDIIYEMNEWVKETLATKIPKEKVLESIGRAKILKIFSKVKDKQIVGGRVEKGSVTVGAQVKIQRREVEIGEGKIRELQQQKVTTAEVKEGREFGALIVSNIEIAPGDYIDNFIITEK